MGQTLDLTGHYDVVYSPDDGGWWSSLLWDRKIDSPVFRSQAAARNWAKKRGGSIEHVAVS